MTSSSLPVHSSTARSIWRFGPFEVDARAAELRRDGTVVKLQPQPFRVLALLVEHAGDLVTRDELQRALWGDETYVDFERGLNFCVNQVRAALGDSADSPRFIQTVPRRGYRFIAPLHPEPVRNEPSAPPDTIPGQPHASRRTTPAGLPAAVAGAALLALLVAGASFLARSSARPVAANPGRTMIAVLPLDDLTGDPPPSWFADGLTDELIAQIGRVSPARLGVIARTSAMTYRESSKSVSEIGRELGVSHIVEGSLRRDGSTLRVTVQLVGIADQTPIWSESYDRSVHGSLAIQSEIAAQVTRALALELLPAPWALPTWTGTHNPDARDAYLRGRYFRNRGGSGDLKAALDEFDAAARLDPRFAAARAAQADTYHRLAMFGEMLPADAYSRAAPAAREAVRLDPNLAEAHAAMGLVELWANWNPAAAMASLERALTLNPSDAAAHHDLGWALVMLQRFDEAVAHVTRARDLDPLSPRANNDIGWMYLQIRQPSEALRACRHTLALDPGSIEAQQCLERAHLQRGEITEAVAAARSAAERRRMPLPAALDEAVTPEARLRALWRWRLNGLETLARQRYVSPYTIAMHHAVLDDDDGALARLEEAYAAGAGSIVLLPTDPLFERMRGTPRFDALVARIRARAGQTSSLTR